MPPAARRTPVVPRSRPRLTVRLGVRIGVGVILGLVAGPLVVPAASASSDREPHILGRQPASHTLALDLGHHPAVRHRLHRAPGQSRGHRAQGVGAAVGHRHGTDTHGGDGSSTERDLALAATWHVDPTLLTPQPGDSSATLQARAELASVADHLKVVMDRYNQARAAAQDAAEAAAKSRVELQVARQDAAAAHRVYVRDHRLLVQLVTTDYEEPPLTSMDFLMAARNVHDLMVGMGTMQQVGINQASVVTAAQAATDKMRATAAAARLAAEAARLADQKARDTLAAAADAGREVLDQVHKAQNVLTLSVLADQMQTSLADAMKYAKELKPGSVSFPLPAKSGFYDNHNWGELSPHWASIHTGDDYSVACGTPVLAATAGKIQILTDQSWAGPWLVMVSTGSGKLTTWYAHMQALAVEPGQHVKPGQIIGQVGQEGNATGCHLHFELHPDGGSIYQDTTDPDPWLKAVGSYPGG